MRQLEEDEEYMCRQCRENEESPVIDCINYLESYLPLPKNTFNKMSPEYELFDSRLKSRAIIFMLMDRVIEDPYDDPCDIVLDMSIEICQFEKNEDDEQRVLDYDIYRSALSDLRHYLMAVGYGDSPLSRY